MPRITIRKDQYEKVYSAIYQTSEGRNKVITIQTKVRKKPIQEGDMLHIYWFSIVNNRYTKIGVLVCKQEETKNGFQHLMLQNTYDRKYYLHRKIKRLGYILELDELTKTIVVKPEMLEKVKTDLVVRELRDRFNYGVQLAMM